MNQTDWEKLARELCLEIFKEHAASIWSAGERPNWADKALQLGREMADEAFGQAVRGVDKKMREAADARAEEIARKIEEGVYGVTLAHVEQNCARIARSTIKKPETIMPPKDARHPGDYDVVCDRSTGKLYRYAKGVALDYQLDSVRRGNPYLEPKDWALPRWQQDKPKTREQVLEDALREIEMVDVNESDHAEINRKRVIARRALEWRP